MSIDPRIASQPQLADDARPVAVAEARCAHLHERQFAEDAVLADHVPAHCRVLAVHVEDSRRPFADLRDRVDQIDELMTGLPFEAEVLVREFVEHQLPSVGIVRDVPVAARPVAVHRAVLERDPHALVRRAPGEPPQISRKRGRLSVSGLPRMRPVKPLTVSVPNKCALSMIVSQPRAPRDPCRHPRADCRTRRSS